MSLGKLEPEDVAYLYDMASNSAFPHGFAEYNLYAEQELARGRWPAAWIPRSKKEEKGAIIAEAILRELKILICENDPKYRDVISSTKRFVQRAIAAIAGYVAATFDIQIALATSAVAACLLVVVRVGREAFCRALYEKAPKTK